MGLDILHSFPKNLLAGIAINLPLIGVAYFLFWKLFAHRLRNWRIQIQRRADKAQLLRELRNSFGALSAGALIASVMTYLGTMGYTKIYMNAGEHPWWISLASVPILLLVDDAWFYWVHRLLHHKALYKYIHHEHHRSVDVTPFTTLSFHWAEPLLLTLWIVPVSLLFPIYAPALLIMQLYGFLDNLKSHLGYEIYPAGLNRSGLRFLTSSTYHNLHHTRFSGNYGVHFRFWDWLMKTELDNYHSTYDAIQQRKKNGD